MASHAQRFANEIFPAAVHADPLAFARALATDDAARVLAPLWEAAGAQLPPEARVDGAGLAATVEKRASGLYVIAIVAPPAPRETGDPALIAIIGRGDGVARLSTIAYYVLEIVLQASGAPRFTVVSRGERDRIASWADAPMPDARMLADHVFELYGGLAPPPHVGVPELPAWYWWHTFGGAAAVAAFDAARDDAERLDAVKAAPIVLLPEIADAAHSYLGAAVADRLRGLRAHLGRSPTFGWAWRALVEKLGRTTIGSPAANQLRLLPVVQEVRELGGLSRAEAYELEGTLRANLVALGVEPAANQVLADELFAAARAAADAAAVPAAPVQPAIPTEDPVWRPLFLDPTDLPDHVLAEEDEALSSAEPTFVALGGLRAGYVAWAGAESSPMVRIVDARWVFRTAADAMRFMRGGMPLGDSLPPVATPPLGDDVAAFGNDGTSGGRRSYMMWVRVGRVVAKLQALEGAHATASRQILHVALLRPLANKIVLRARNGLAQYWLAVAYPTNAVPALLHSPGYNVAQLLPKYPLLAHPELPTTLSALGDTYAECARALASFQAQLRANRWPAYRVAMLALVRSLLASDMGDPRVNVAHAHEIVTELRYLDQDPIWEQLDAECRARL